MGEAGEVQDMGMEAWGSCCATARRSPRHWPCGHKEHFTCVDEFVALQVPNAVEYPSTDLARVDVPESRQASGARTAPDKSAARGRCPVSSSAVVGQKGAMCLRSKRLSVYNGLNCV
jgi:hypothetical protein